MNKWTAIELELSRFFGIDLTGVDVRVLKMLVELKKEIEMKERLNFMQDIRVAMYGNREQFSKYIMENFNVSATEEEVRANWEKLTMIGRG